MGEELKQSIKTVVARETALASCGQRAYRKEMFGVVSFKFSCFAIATEALWAGARQQAY